jgi:hypothetical protein
LFEDTQKQLRLYEAIDKVKLRFGADAVMSASAFGGIGRGRGQRDGFGDEVAEKSKPSHEDPPPARATRRALPG